MVRESSKSGDRHHKSSKSRKAKNKSKSVDYGPNLQDKGGSGDKKPTKPGSGSTQPKQLASDVDVNAVPNPAPDTGTHTYIYFTQTPVHTGILPAVPTTTLGFSPLPPLASFATTGTASTTAIYTSSNLPSASSSPTPTGPVHSRQSTQANATKRMPTVEIVVVVVGAAFVVFGILAAFWICTRPRKRTHPIPSLPILQDDYAEHKAEGDEESLFGGKERTSAQPGSNGILWNWTQYPHTSMSNKSSVKTDTAPGEASAQSRRISNPFNEKHGHPFNGHGTSAQPSAQNHAPLQHQLQTALNKASNRVSAMSASIYPSSPQSQFGGYTGIGVALGGGSSPADDMPILQRNGSKTSTRRQSAVLRSGDRQSVALPRRSSHDYSNITGKALTTASPTVAKPGLVVQAGGGRVPVKGPYAPTASMRSSASVSRVPSVSRRSMANPFESAQYVLPSVKSEARRERDTQALTSALGLTSPPPPPSPQTTIHPDDSITLAGDRRRSRNLGHSRMQSTMLSPTLEASARLGNLMLSEFQSMNSLPSSRAVNVGPAPPVPITKAVNKRTDDRPPRVPSPPPMPSLAQMALAHTNPDSYADYRSPTYSIYGLYEADRKSRAPGEGGY